MKTTLTVIGFSATTAVIAYNFGLIRQYKKDSKIFQAAVEAMKNVVQSGTMEAAEDIATTFKMDITEF